MTSAQRNVPRPLRPSLSLFSPLACCFKKNSAHASLAGRSFASLSLDTRFRSACASSVSDLASSEEGGVMNVVAATAGPATAAAAQGDVTDVDASTPPAPVPRPRHFPCLGDSPGPRCGHTLTSITGPDGNLASARLVLFGTREEEKKRAIRLFLDGIADARLPWPFSTASLALSVCGKLDPTPPLCYRDSPGSTRSSERRSRAQKGSTCCCFDAAAAALLGEGGGAADENEKKTRRQQSLNLFFFLFLFPFHQNQNRWRHRPRGHGER